MRENKKHRMFSMLLAVLLLCTVMATPAMAPERNTWKTVRVSCDINNALYLNEEGKPEGYCNEYLLQLAEIKEHGKVVVGVYQDTEPLFGIAGDRSYEGIYKDIIERVHDLSGLDLEIKALDRNDAKTVPLWQSVPTLFRRMCKSHLMPA